MMLLYDYAQVARPMGVTVTRPGHREIDKRLREAQQALDQGKALFATPAKAVGELLELDLDDPGQLWPLLSELLDEVATADYAGGSPPQRSYEPAVANCELWAFAWESRRLEKTMYVKFAMKAGCYYYISLHESRPCKGR